jgi:hypothetical protein
VGSIFKVFVFLGQAALRAKGVKKVIRGGHACEQQLRLQVSGHKWLQAAAVLQVWHGVVC